MLGANHRHGNSNQQKLSFPYYSEDMTVSLSFLLPSLEYDCFFSSPPCFPSSLSRSVFFFISYHTHHSVSLLPGSYSVILIITTVQEDNIYIQFRLFLIRKKVGARLGRVQFKPKYWQVKDTFSFLTDPNLNPHVPVLVSAKVLSHPRNTRWKKKVGLVRISWMSEPLGLNDSSDPTLCAPDTLSYIHITVFCAVTWLTAYLVFIESSLLGVILTSSAKYEPQVDTREIKFNGKTRVKGV